MKYLSILFFIFAIFYITKNRSENKGIKAIQKTNELNNTENVKNKIEDSKVSNPKKQDEVKVLNFYPDESIENLIKNEKYELAERSINFEVNDIISRSNTDVIDKDSMYEALILTDNYIESYPILKEKSYNLIYETFTLASNIDQEGKLTKKYYSILNKYHATKIEKQCIDFYYHLNFKDFFELEKIVKKCLQQKKDPNVIIDWMGVYIAKHGYQKAKAEYKRFQKRFQSLPRIESVFSMDN